jgi:hypothetical protein
MKNNMIKLKATIDEVFCFFYSVMNFFFINRQVTHRETVKIYTERQGVRSINQNNLRHTNGN